MSEFLQWSEEDGVVTLTMDRPRERNALTGVEQFEAFEQACRRIQADASIKVAILTGAGPAFCAGGNLKDMVERGGMFGGGPADVRAQYRAGIHRIPRALEQLDVPLIAAVNGPAIGAGCDLACMCDLRIASTAARFGEVFVQLGLIPGDGGCWFLQRAIGYARAAEMVLTGDALGAEEALACGLVSRVTPPDRLLDEAGALARRIAANDAGGVRMAKVLLRHARQSSLDNALELAAAFQAIAHHGPGHAQALARVAARGN